MPSAPMPSKATVLPSGTAAEEPENENSPDAAGSCVVKDQVPGVVRKPFPEILPVPVTLRKPFPCCCMAELLKLKVNPSTAQKLAIAPELNVHVGVKVTSSNRLTKVAKSPSRLCTCGLSPAPGPCQAVTIVALLTDIASSSTLPANVILPVMKLWAWVWVQKKPAEIPITKSDRMVLWRNVT